MIFLKPEYLYMMLIPTLIMLFFIVSQKSVLEQYFDKEVLEKLQFDNGALGKVGRNILLFVALISMILALARPVKEKEDVQIKRKSIDMMLALDVSKSMMAGDLYPSRFAFAKQRFVEFVDSFKEANIGVVAFSSQGFLVSPMTQDSTTLKYLVNNLSLDSISLKGTDMMIPIEKGAAFLKNKKDKIIIIMTDGGDNDDFSEEIAKAKKYGESIYIYAVATPEGAPIKEQGEAIKDKKGNMVISKLNEKIKALAFETGGAYIVGHHQDSSVQQMVADIKKKFKMHEGKSKKVKEYKEFFYYPLGVAILFLLFAFHSFVRLNQALMLGMLLAAVPKASQAKMFDFFDINQGEKAYHDKRYKEAGKYYKEVVKSNKSPESIYDLANAQYKQGRYKEALKNYKNVIATTDALKYKKAFNEGNSHFQMKAYDKAIQAYEQAKKIKSDEDLEANIELAKKKLKEKKEQEKKKSDKKEDDNGKDKKKKEKNREGKEKPNKQTKPDKKPAKAQKPKKEEISEKEEKKWQQHLEKNKPKTMPMPFKKEPTKRKLDEKPW